MACVALKRPCEFDSMNATSSKRARHVGPVRSMAVNSTDLMPPFAELPRKMSPKKVATPASVPLQEIRGRRLDHQLKFDEAPPRVLEHIVPGEKYEGNEDQPLFTFSQLKLIVERRLKEQAQRIREDYERILQEKISEQYDTFVKFTHDQIMRGNHKPDALPSYLS